MKSRQVRYRSERGAELIEFALVFPLLLLVVLGIVDFGFLFQRMEVVTNAAREGARIAVLSGYDRNDVCERAVNYMQSGGLVVSGGACNCPGDGNCTAPTNPVISIDGFDTPFPITFGSSTLNGKRVIVRYSSNYLFLGPLIGWFGGSLSSVPVKAQAIMGDEVPAVVAGS